MLAANAADSDSDCELQVEPPQFQVKRRVGLCAEPMIKGYFKEPYWNKHESWVQQLLMLLVDCVIFRHNTKDEVAKMVRAMSTHLAMKDELICAQGDKMDSLIVVLSGNINLYKGSKLVGNRSVGSIIDATAVLLASPRPFSIYASEDNVILAKLSRECFTNLSIRFKFYKRGAEQEMIQNSKLLEMLDEEQTAALADVLKMKEFGAGEFIIKQGDEGKEMFFLDDGEARVWVKKGNNDEQEYCRYHRGALFGELSLLKNAPRAANVTAVTKVRALSLSRASFQRILGPLNELQERQYQTDPRKIIADFYTDGDGRGPLGSLVQKGLKPDPSHGKSEWFVVYRPCSRDAIAKMLNGHGVGKGLNVKGKSAKQGCLSGFVPYVQVSDNKHKPMIEQSPPGARCKIYYKSKGSRVEAHHKLQNIMTTAEDLRMDNRRIDVLDDFLPFTYGLDVPEALVRESYLMRPDLSPVFGWETGRRSEPFSMDMNLHASRGETGKIPEVVCYQHDEMDVMNPRGMLVAYAEEFVKPVVSDFDTFTVASQGMMYDSLPEEQAQLILWALGHTKDILSAPDHQAWSSRWIEVLRKENERGFHPTLPMYGFGDPTSYSMVGEVVQATKASGAVRHGAECFNFGFPQELDDEFLVVWTKLPDKPWTYFPEPKLQTFLLDRVKDGYAFPINPVWPIRDQGWWDVLSAVKDSAEGKRVYRSWFLPHLQIMEKVETLHKQFPAGFKQQVQDEPQEKAPTKPAQEPTPAERPAAAQAPASGGNAGYPGGNAAGGTNQPKQGFFGKTFGSLFGSKK
jgi:cAMP-dependent protein kinase regulator